MKKIMAALLLPAIKLILKKLITRENYEKMMDWLLDLLEGWAAKTYNKIDDAGVAKIREILGIPDSKD